MKLTLEQKQKMQEAWDLERQINKLHLKLCELQESWSLDDRETYRAIELDALRRSR